MCLGMCVLHYLVQLTDGIQTQSDALSVAALLERKGVRVDAIQYASQILKSEVEIKDVALPLSMALGQSTMATVPLNCNTKMAGVLSEDGKQVIMGMIDTLMPQMYMVNAMTTQMISGGTACTLRVTCAQDNEGQTIKADITAPDGTQYKGALSRVRTGIYEYTIPLSGFGKYDMVLYQYMDDVEQPVLIHTAATLSWSLEYEAFPTLAEKALLAQLCQTTGGDAVEDVASLLQMDLSSLYVMYDPIVILVLIGALAFILEITFRKTGKSKKNNMTTHIGNGYNP